MNRFAGMLVAVSGLLVSTAASAQVVELVHDQGGEAYQLVSRLYENELSRYGVHSIDTAIVDIQGDGAGEVVARITSSSTCQQDRGCLTVVAHYDSERGGWQEVLRASARERTIELAEAGEDGVRDIILDGDHAFTWYDGGYVRDLSITMDEVIFDRQATDDMIAALRRDAPTYYNPEEFGDTRVYMGLADVNDDGQPETFLHISNRVVCGTLIGCPLLAYGDPAEPPFFRSSSADGIYISGERHGGLRDIVLTNGLGNVSRMWDGSEWVANRVYYDYEENS